MVDSTLGLACWILATIANPVQAMSKSAQAQAAELPLCLSVVLTLGDACWLPSSRPGPLGPTIKPHIATPRLRFSRFLGNQQGNVYYP